MLQFANSFQCTYLSDQNKIVLKFRQAIPNIDKKTGEQDSSEPVIINELVDLVVDSGFAEKLADAIHDLCKKDLPAE